MIYIQLLYWNYNMHYVSICTMYIIKTETIMLFMISMIMDSWIHDEKLFKSAAIQFSFVALTCGGLTWSFIVIVDILTSDVTITSYNIVNIEIGSIVSELWLIEKCKSSLFVNNTLTLPVCTSSVSWPQTHYYVSWQAAHLIFY